MPEEWAAALVGEMFRCKVTGKALAKEAGWSEKYLSAVLHGRRRPRGAEEKLKKALLRLELRKAQAGKGLYDSLEELLADYEQRDPAYGKRLAEIMGMEVPNGRTDKY